MRSLSTSLNRPGWSFSSLSEEAVLPLWPGPAGVLGYGRERMSRTALDQGSLSVPESPQHSRTAREARALRDAGDRAMAAMDAYAHGDDDAFAAVYDAIAPRVFVYLSRQTRDQTTAADLLQQTLLQIHKHRGSYESGAPVLPWAFAIARRLFIDEFRKKKTDALSNARDMSDDDRTAAETPDEVASMHQAALRVQDVLSRLPESQRTAFELLRVEGLSHDDAARALGVTVSAVKLRAFRAYRALRAVLGDVPTDPEPRPSRPPRR